MSMRTSLVWTALANVVGHCLNCGGRARTPVCLLAKRLAQSPAVSTVARSSATVRLETLALVTKTTDAMTIALPIKI